MLNIPIVVHFMIYWENLILGGGGGEGLILAGEDYRLGPEALFVSACRKGNNLVCSQNYGLVLVIGHIMAPNN